MSTAQVSGPCYMYIARPTTTYLKTSELYFLGTCEQPPTIQLNPQWEPVMNDIGGSLLPIDYSYQGEDGLISGTLNKWNELVYRRLASHALYQGISSRGVEYLGVPTSGGQLGLGGDIGKLSQTEDIAFRLIMHFPYAAKTVFGGFTVATGLGGVMPAGYQFYSCRLAGHVIGPGTRANRRQLIIHADRELAESATVLSNGFTLYDNTMIATVDGAAPGTNIFPQTPPLSATGQVSAG